MAIEADKFNKTIKHKGEVYSLSIYGMTVRKKRKYDVDISYKHKPIGNVYMVYNPVTGNFVVEGTNGKNMELKQEMELLISDAIQNYHL